jgi:soluble lytic murein transglycosylase-like protein
MPHRRALPRFFLVALLAAFAQPAAARGGGGAAEDPDWLACRRAIAAVEPGAGLPPGLLGAIALVESGRRDPRTGRVEPWPWAYNVEGEGHHPATRAQAVAEVAALLAAGRRSVDVGCMQVNLAHHPAAFPGGLEQAFEPEANLRYAAAFLRDLRARTGDWAQATANYHSGQAERGLLYHRRVTLARIGAGFSGGGVGGAIPLPAAAAGGLCAAGMAPVLVAAAGTGARRPPARAGVRPRIVCRKAAAGRS